MKIIPVVASSYMRTNGQTDGRTWRS